MTKIILFLLFSCSIRLSYSQNSGTIKDSFNSYSELRNKQSLAKIETFTYIDSTYNFQVQVPNWLNLIESGRVNAWGGTLPAVDNIENAIVIKSIEKKKFKSFKEFKKYINGDRVLGKMPGWSTSHIYMGGKDLGKYKNIGDAYKVYLMRDKTLYYCEYILAETKTAYLWIDFTSTQETFDKNINKFDEFMNGFKIINFKR